MSRGQFYLDKSNAKICGVCAGIARRFGWDPTVVRIVAAVSILLPGPQVIAYLVLWALMPNDRD